MEVWSPRNCIETPFKEKPWKRIIIMTTNFNIFESFGAFCLQVYFHLIEFFCAEFFDATFVNVFQGHLTTVSS